MKSLVIAITGAASGLGYAAATYLSARGHRVLGGGLGLPDTSFSFPTRYLDVRECDSVRDFFAWVAERESHLDALVNCAGIQLAGALESMLIEETQQIIETNVVGVFRCCQAVLPRMRTQGQGRIINVSSLGGRIAFPFHTSYCASKFAVEGLSECLRYEVSRFGIQVSVLAPGSFYTAIAEQSACSANAWNAGEYTELLRRVIEVNKAECRRSTELAPFARKIEAILACKRPRLRYFVGRPAQGLGDVLRRLLPGSWTEAIVRRKFGLR